LTGGYAETMTDFPDWQTFANAQSDNIMGAYSQVLMPGPHSTTVLPCLSWSSLILVVSPSAGAAKVKVTHFADLAATQPIDSDTWAVNSTTALIVRTPLRGKFVRIDITVTSAGNLTAITWANFLSATSDRVSFPVGQQNVSDFAHSLAANATALYTVGEIAAGQALFFINPHDTAGKLLALITATDELGNSGQLVAFFGQPTTYVQQLIVVPDVILQVEIVNTDGAAAHVYDFSFTIPPQ
jgi:hypothetical protein